MTRSTGDALFAAVLADPADANARTVYAEWLEDNDQPETAAWWRGQQAASLMVWLRAIQDTSFPGSLPEMVTRLNESVRLTVEAARALPQNTVTWQPPPGCGVPGQDLECVECGVRLYGRNAADVCRRRPPLSDR